MSQSVPAVPMVAGWSTPGQEGAGEPPVADTTCGGQDRTGQSGRMAAAACLSAYCIKEQSRTDGNRGWGGGGGCPTSDVHPSSILKGMGGADLESEFSCVYQRISQTAPSAGQNQRPRGSNQQEERSSVPGG